MTMPDAKKEKVLTVELQALERIHGLSISLLSPLPVVESLRLVKGCEAVADKLEATIRAVVPVLMEAQEFVHAALDRAPKKK
jgi:hypothetical protein